MNPVVKERGSRYGSFYDNARITQECENVFKSAPSYHKASDVQKEALHMIIQKMSRCFCGDTTYEDNWVDVVGYAENVLIHMKGE